MATRRGDIQTTSTHRTHDRTLSRYDVQLLVIPAVFTLALLAAQVSPLGVSPLLAAASVVGAFAMADALFVNPPQGPSNR